MGIIYPPWLLYMQTSSIFSCLSLSSMRLNEISPIHNHKYRVVLKNIVHFLTLNNYIQDICTFLLLQRFFVVIQNFLMTRFSSFPILLIFHTYFLHFALFSLKASIDFQFNCPLGLNNHWITAGCHDEIERKEPCESKKYMVKGQQLLRSGHSTSRPFEVKVCRSFALYPFQSIFLI